MSNTSIGDLREIIGECDLQQLQHIASAMHSRLNEFREDYSESSNLEEAAEFAKGIALDLAGARAEIAITYKPHPTKCQCDLCAAARSDEHHDRHGER